MGTPKALILSYLLSPTPYHLSLPYTRFMVVSRSRERIAGPGLDWSMALLALIFVGGLFLDGWAHTHGKVDDSFFTPWHGVLYSGFALNLAALLGVAWVNRSRGYPLPAWLPSGYWLSLVGMALWLIGGPGDLIWHTLFGIEESIDALYSPTHLLLASGLTLAASGPFRAFWARPGSPKGLAEQLPMLLSLAATLSTLGFFIQYTHPVVNDWGLGRFWDDNKTQALGVVSLLLSSSLTIGVLLLTMRRWTLAPGAISLVLTLSGVALGFVKSGPYPGSKVLVFALAAMALDGLYRWLKPGRHRVAALRGFAFWAPLLLVLSHFAVGWMQYGVSWSVHLTWGVIFLNGIAGLLLSLLVVPPAMPAE